MFPAEVKCSGSKIVLGSDLRVRTVLRRNNSKEINLNIGTRNIRTLRQTIKLENVILDIDKCELKVVGLSEVRWPGKDKIFSRNYILLLRRS